MPKIVFFGKQLVEEKKQLVAAITIDYKTLCRLYLVNKKQADKIFLMGKHKFYRENAENGTMY